MKVRFHHQLRVGIYLEYWESSICWQVNLRSNNIIVMHCQLVLLGVYWAYDENNFPGQKRVMDVIVHVCIKGVIVKTKNGLESFFM